MLNAYVATTAVILKPTKSVEFLVKKIFSPRLESSVVRCESKSTLRA